MHGNTAEDMRRVVAGFGPVELTLGKTKCFSAAESGKPYDVVYVEVKSPSLERLNSHIRASLPHTDTHQSYAPHITLAYVKPGLGEKYAGDGSMKGHTLSCHELIFSTPDKERTVIDLATVPMPDDDEESDDDELMFADLASNYADEWNALESTGDEVPDAETRAADDELDGTGWAVNFDPRAGQWEVVEDPLGGGVMIAGEWGYPDEDDEDEAEQYAKASDANDWHEVRPGLWRSDTLKTNRRQKSMPGSRKAKPKAIKATKTKVGTGDSMERKAPDVAGMRERLKAHKAELTDADKKKLANSLRALKAHHGANLTGRLEEMVGQAEKQLGKAKTDEARGVIGKKLAGLEFLLGKVHPGAAAVVQEEWGKPYGDARFNTPDGEVVMRRKGTSVRFFDSAGKQVGPEQRNVAPGFAYAMAQGWTEAIDQPAKDTSHWGSKEQPYWRPGKNPTVDNIITRDNPTTGQPEVLLIQRKEGTVEGGKWALPGGFHDTDAKKGEPWKPGHETAEEAALRELKEETGLDSSKLKGSIKPVGTFEGNGRDPRDNKEAWSSSSAFTVHLTPEQAKAMDSVKGQDDASAARWVPVSELPEMKLAFDHGKILEDAGVERTPKPPKPLFTGTDRLGRKWVNGKLVKKDDTATPDVPILSTEDQAALPSAPTVNDDDLERTSGSGEGRGSLHPGQPVGEDAGASSEPLLPGIGEGTGGGAEGLRRRDDGGGEGLLRAPGGPGDESARREGTGDGTAAADAARRAGSDGGVGDGGGGGEHDAGSETVSEPASPENPTDVSAGNFHYSRRDFAVGGPKVKYLKNLAAIRTMQAIKAEGRDRATPAEQEILSQYVGWGAFPALFNDYGDDKTPYEEKERLRDVLSEEEWDARFAIQKWRKERETIKSLISEEEWDSAKRSTLNAHFTSPAVVDAHWKIAQRLGFKGGKFLETSAGIGYYMGLMPPQLAGATKTSAVELDTTTGNMLKQLYPKANVKVEGFQDFKAPNGFYDLVASNVPFGAYKVHDPEYNKHQANIHDYFFLKSLDLARPGGLVMHITSTGTLDKPDSAIRAEMAKSADIVGAIRFPGGAHKENAGTEVVTDMVILRKRTPGEQPVDPVETPKEAMPKKRGFTGITTDALGRLYHWQDGKRVPGPNWLDTTTVPDPAGGEPIPVNKYFAEHPEQILGTLDRTGTMYAGKSPNVSLTDDYEDRLAKAIEMMPEGVMTSTAAPGQRFTPEVMPAPGDVKEGGYTIKKGKLYAREHNALVEQKVKPGVIAKVEGQLGIRDAMRAVINLELEGKDATEERKTLNSVYDAYVEKYGFLNAQGNRLAFLDDPDSPVVLALENYDPETKQATKSDMFSKNTIRADVTVDHVENVGEALSVSLHETGGVDVERMAKLSGKSQGQIEKELVDQGIAFQDPSEGWKQADLYLSGNVRRKLVMARAAADTDPKYKANVAALEKVQPEDIAADNTDEGINVKLGAPWVPPSDVSDFAAHLLEGNADHFDIKYHPASGWKADYTASGDRRLAMSRIAREKWSTKRTNFMNIMNAALNNTPITIRDKESDGTTVVNRWLTDDAMAKVQEMKEAFKEWIWEDDARKERLHRFYNDNFNNVRNIEYNGSHQTFPGMNPAITLKDHQKNFVWQVVTTGVGLAAHEVGTGKTNSMIAAAMELRRLGLARKPALACLKANIEGITKAAARLYPGAKILSTANVTDAASRKKAISQIATGDYDLVILTHDNLEMLPMKPETVAIHIREEIKELEAAKAAAYEDDPSKGNKVVKDLEKSKLALEAKLKKALDATKKDDAVYFEETGVDHLFVDESQQFRSLPIFTKTRGLKGIPTSRSNRATDMRMRTQWLMEHNNGRGVVFATGTPVMNTMAEVYTLQRYLQPEQLKERGLDSFDAWANVFGEVKTDMEFTVSGEYKPVSRFKKFVNIPELMQTIGQVMDVQRADTMTNPDGTPSVIRPKRKDSVIAAPKSEAMDRLMESLQTRAKAIKGRAEKGSDNMLVICTDGRKGSIDMRLLDANAPDDPQSKTNLAINKVLEINKARPGVAQIIFSDIGVNEAEKGGGFHLYKDIINKLVRGGIARNQIADFSKLEGKKKEDAMQGMRTGKILVGIGSTQKLGTGVNVQKKIAALHHLDVPWLPGNVEQRDGRGWRQGNLNDPSKPANEQKLDIYRYVSEGSLDQTFWQIIGNKTGFIRQVVNSKGKTGRVARDEDTEELTPEQLMAAASGDPRIMEKVNLDEEVKNLRSAEDRHKREQDKFKRAVGDIEKNSLPRLKKLADEASKFAQHLENHPDFELEIDGKKYTDRKEATQAYLDKTQEIFENASEYGGGGNGKIGTFRGVEILKSNGKVWLKIPGGAAEIGNVSRIGKEVGGDTLGSIEYVTRNAAKQKEVADSDVTKAHADMERIRGDIGKEFTKAKELQEKRQRAMELESEIKESRNSVITNHETPAPRIHSEPAPSTPSLKGSGAHEVARSVGRTVLPGAKEQSFNRHVGNGKRAAVERHAHVNMRQVGEVFTRKGQEFVVTDVRPMEFVSDDAIEDHDAWSKYPDGAGWYSSYTAVPAAPPSPNDPAPAAIVAASVRPVMSEPKPTSELARKPISTRKVMTSRGRRVVHSFAPTEAFWSARKAGKLPKNVSVSKNPKTDKWEASVWGDDEKEIHEALDTMRRDNVIRHSREETVVRYARDDIRIAEGETEGVQFMAEAHRESRKMAKPLPLPNTKTVALDSSGGQLHGSFTHNDEKVRLSKRYEADEDDDGLYVDLAHDYASDWNEVEASGKEVPNAETQDADEELDGTGWSVNWDTRVGRWEAEPALGDNDDVGGGVTINGRYFYDREPMPVARQYAAVEWDGPTKGPRGGTYWTSKSTGRKVYRDPRKKPRAAKPAAPGKKQAAEKKSPQPKAAALAKPLPLPQGHAAAEKGKPGESISDKTLRQAQSEYDQLKIKYLNKGAGTYNADRDLTSVVLNTDDWRVLFPEYHGTNAADVHSASSYLNKKLLAESLVSMQGKGNNKMVILAGGGGSGKSGIGKFFDEKKYPIRLDQVSDELDSLVGKIEMAQSHGFGVDYTFVDRDPGDAWLEGVVVRAIHSREKNELARTVPINIALEANINSRKTALELLKKKPNIPVQVLDNSKRFKKARMITDRDEAIKHLESRMHFEYPKLLKEMTAATMKMYQEGKMPKDIAEGLLGKSL